MDIPTDLPTVILTPVNDVLLFALLIGLLSGVVTVAIDLTIDTMWMPQSLRPSLSILLGFALAQIGLLGALFTFFAFVILGENPVMSAIEVDRTILTMAGCIIVGLGFGKVLNTFRTSKHSSD